MDALLLQVCVWDGAHAPQPLRAYMESATITQQFHTHTTIHTFLFLFFFFFLILFKISFSFF